MLQAIELFLNMMHDNLITTEMRNSCINEALLQVQLSFLVSFSQPSILGLCGKKFLILNHF